MSTPPSPFGLDDTIHETARKLREVMDLDRATAEEIRRWTLVGIVDIHVRMAQLEKMLERQDKMLERQEKLLQSAQRLTLVAAGLAWTALVFSAFALARVL